MSKKLTKEEIQQLASERNHELISLVDFEQKYKNVHSKLEFKCLTCGTTFETSVHSYKNAKRTGCPDCKKQTASKTHKGKAVSEQTRALIGENASQRPGSLTGHFGADHPRYTGGYARDKEKRSSADYLWIKEVKNLSNNACALTGVKTNLVCHHLEGWNCCPERRYDLTNGVCIAQSVHDEFHRQYGFGNNTEAQFAEFCTKDYNIDWYTLKENLWKS